MTITVYWSVLNREWMRAKEPESVAKKLYEKKMHVEDPLQNFHRCPFTHDYLQNIYSLHSLYDYSFFIDNGQVRSDYYNQDFFDDHVTIRSIENKFFSFSQPFVFFTEESSLTMEIPQFPYLENNNITQRCIPFVGAVDIGKYFRALDFAFFIKDPYTEFIIQEDEVFGYIKFNTQENIAFKQFQPTEKIYQYSDDVRHAFKYRKIKFAKPQYFYDKFKIKNSIIKEIKNNLVD